MNSSRSGARGIFFILFVLVCLFISVLFFVIFRRTDTPLVLSAYLPSLPAGLPGMNLPSEMNPPNELGKPLPSPSLPVPPTPLTVSRSQINTASGKPIPLIAKAAPPGPPSRKPMMT